MRMRTIHPHYAADTAVDTDADTSPLLTAPCRSACTVPAVTAVPAVPAVPTYGHVELLRRRRQRPLLLRPAPMPVRRPLFGVHADGRVAWRVVVVGLNGGGRNLVAEGCEGGFISLGGVMVMG